MIGKIHSIQSLGTVDGPGVRFVVFMQGCNLRCGCCHNPDTWDINAGTDITAAELVKKAERYKGYFGDLGGITVSGGEPLLQSGFCHELFSLCKDCGINTCLDTSGSILNDDVRLLLTKTDRILLDIKYASDELYKRHVGCLLQKPLEFLKAADKAGIPVTVRQVIIPTLNDDIQSVKELKRIVSDFECVDTIELLPFKKMCYMKYQKLGIEFPFGNLPEPTADKMQELEKMI